MKLLLTLIISVIYIGQASAGVDCQFVERMGNHFSQKLADELDKNLKGEKFRINDLQELQLRGVDEVDFRGCLIDIKVLVKIKRRIFGNVKGYMMIEGEVTKLNPSEVCFGDIKVNKVRLRGSGDVGRAIYRAAANEALPNNKCFDIN